MGRILEVKMIRTKEAILWREKVVAPAVYLQVALKKAVTAEEIQEFILSLPPALQHPFGWKNAALNVIQHHIKRVVMGSPDLCFKGREKKVKPPTTFLHLPIYSRAAI